MIFEKKIKQQYIESTKESNNVISKIFSKKLNKVEHS